MPNKGRKRRERDRDYRRSTLIVLTSLAALLTACSDAPSVSAISAVSAGDRYVSLGSSFASGPGVSVSADMPANRCSRSQDNYAHQLARKRKLNLVDVSCSGAKTVHVTGPWNELPPQIEAVTADTRLVTVTIGGNDVGFIGGLIAAACAHAPAPPPGAPGGRCPPVAAPTEADWSAMEAGLGEIASQVRKRAPMARLMFVQYVPTVARSACLAVPLNADELAAAIVMADRLKAVTAKLARIWGADVVDPAGDGTAHDPCAAEPWATGFPLPGGSPFVPFHPNLAGMTAIANEIDRVLGK
jgi:lysophospholipase L1-like esterase